ARHGPCSWSPSRSGDTQRSGFARPFFSAGGRSSDMQGACQGVQPPGTPPAFVSSPIRRPPPVPLPSAFLLAFPHSGRGTGCGSEIAKSQPVPLPESAVREGRRNQRKKHATESIRHRPRILSAERGPFRHRPAAAPASVEDLGAVHVHLDEGGSRRL